MPSYARSDLGANDGARTRYLLDHNQALYLMSYTRHVFAAAVEPANRRSVVTLCAALSWAPRPLHPTLPPERKSTRVRLAPPTGFEPAAFRWTGGRSSR